MKERYPRESLEWQQWMAGSKVWVSNCIKLPKELDSGAHLLTHHQFVKGVPFPATSHLDRTYSALQISITLTLHVLAVVVNIILEVGELAVAGKLKRRLVVVDLDRLRLNWWEETDIDKAGPKEPKHEVDQLKLKSHHAISKQRRLEK